MNKNMLNKISTASLVMGITALVSLSGVFGANAATNSSNTCGYGYGYGCNPSSFLLPSNDKNVATDGNVVVKTGNDDKTKIAEKPVSQTPKTETPETKKDDRVVKVSGDLVYTLNTKTGDLARKVLSNTSGETTMFTDVTSSEYKTEIEMLARAGIVSGTTKTTFEPNRGITRAEFLAIALQSHGYNVHAKATSTPFSDLTVGDWKTNVVAAALDQKIIYGDTKNGKRVFRPNDKITKIEAMAMLISMRDIQIDSAYTHSYSDAAANWQNKVLNVVEYLGLEGKSKKFNPNSTVNRDRMAGYLVKVLRLY